MLVPELGATLVVSGSFFQPERTAPLTAVVLTKAGIERLHSLACFVTHAFSLHSFNREMLTLIPPQHTQIGLEMKCFWLLYSMHALFVRKCVCLKSRFPFLVRCDSEDTHTQQHTHSGFCVFWGSVILCIIFRTTFSQTSRAVVSRVMDWYRSVQQLVPGHRGKRKHDLTSFS